MKASIEVELLAEQKAAIDDADLKQLVDAEFEKRMKDPKLRDHVREMLRRFF